MKVAVIFNRQEVTESDVINIFGPATKEKYNPKTVELVASALESGGHNVKVIEGNIQVADELKLFMPQVITGEHPGIVFNMAYGIQGQSRYTHIPAMLEMLGVPYVGSGPQAHAVALDKVMTKIVLRQHNIPTPDFWFFGSADDDLSAVTFPVIVKPKMESVSMGLKIVYRQEELREAVAFVIEQFQQQALVERFISGREFAVGMLGNGADLEILPIVEFALPDPDAIQSQEAKMQAPLEKVCPAQIPDDLAESLRDLGRNTFHALGIHDFARIDVRMDDAGNLYVLELNSMASLGKTGSYFKAASTAGYTYNALVNQMLEVAAVRYFGQDYPRTDAEDESPEPRPLRARVRSYARSSLTTMRDTLEQMVEINSYIYNTENVNRLGNFMAKRLQSLGFHRQVFPQTEVGNILYLANHEEPRNDILVLAHLDTGYNYQDYSPFREERGRLYGAGVAESKGGLTILLTALQALRFTRRLKKVRIGILLTSDDALGGRISKKSVAEHAARSGYVIGLKYGDSNGGIVTSSSGGAEYQFDFTGSTGRYTGTPVDVIRVACQKILAWQKLENPDAGIVINPQHMEARRMSGLAPVFATGVLRVEFPDKSQGEHLDEQIRSIARKNLDSRLQVQIKRRLSRPPVLESEPIQEFYNHVAGIARRLEIPLKKGHRAGASEICHVPENIPVLEGLGPPGGDVRTPGEYILRDGLIDRAALLAMVLRLSAGDSKN